MIIAIGGLLLSLITFLLTRLDKRIRLNAILKGDNEGYSIEIYNNSNRQITISYFELYKANFKLFWKRHFAYTWYDDADDVKYVIPPHESKNIQFSEVYKLDGFMKNRNGKHVYISLFVSGKQRKTIRLN